ncbi:MAG: RsbRD N-terminal domain-containing protein [Chloroflexota bacterium]
MELLERNKTSILQRWFNLIAETYPAEVSAFLREKDRFSNPVGYTVSQETSALYDELLKTQADSDRVCAALDSIVRIRAIQDFSPHEAIAFVFLLKEAIKQELGTGIDRSISFGEWLDFEPRIDRLASVAFDIYMKCREKVYELRVNELKAERARMCRLLELTTGGVADVTL